MITAGITLTSPQGSALDFLALFVVVILGPPIVQKARVPGMVGLLLGGFLIGPNGLGILSAGSTTIPDLGQIGLLYLMFIAGVELNLGLMRRHRNSTVTFGLLTFAFPMIFGTAAGLLLGWETPAALLLGSLLASHTLLLYPLAKDAGLADDPVVASAVGATVLTDTITLVVLAVVAGTQSGTGSTADIFLELGVGFLCLGITCFLILPYVARRAFRIFGTERTVRYAITIASFLVAAVVAETFGIEGIVGAFFAGLAMNRLVPNEGPLMSRIDFFGGALFIPVFLVSVGLLLQPSVMFKPETIGLAAIFVVCSMGGKFVAAQSTRLTMGATNSQAIFAWALSTPQAAATLAATTVGFDIGLFGESVVNAVLVLILVTVLVSTLVAERYKSKIAIPEGIVREIGERVLVAVSETEGAPLALRIAREISRHEGGVVQVVLMVDAESETRERQAGLDRISGTCRRLGLDTDPTIRVTDHVARTTILAANDIDASMVLAVSNAGHEHWAETVAYSLPSPVAIVLGDVDAPVRHLMELGTERSKKEPDVVASIVSIINGDPEADLVETPAGLTAGQVGIAGVDEWEEFEGLKPREGTGLLLVPAALIP